MKIFEKTVSVIMTMCFCFGLFACNCEDKSKAQEQNKSNEALSREYEDTDTYLIKNNTTEYELIYPQGMEFGSYLYEAVSYIQKYFYEASGIEIPTKSDNNVEYSADSKYISLGKTTLFEKAGKAYDVSDLKRSGFIMDTVGSTVFLYGGVYGVLYAAQEFLHAQFGLEFYAIDEIKLDKGNYDRKLKNYKNLVTKADLDVRYSESHEVSRVPEVAHIYRMQTLDEIMLPAVGNGGIWHNFLGVFDKDIYLQQHPEWYSNGQLNLSIDVDGMTDVLVGQWKEYMKDCRETSIAFTFTAADTNTWSNAESSVKLFEKYGVYSAEYIKFMNVAARKFNAWMKENHPEKNIKYCIFAYQTTTEPPVKEENGKYVPIDDSVVLEENVTLFFSTSRASMYYAIREEENKTFFDLLNRWKAVTKEQPIYFWTFAVNYGNPFVPLDLSHSMQDNLQWMKDSGGEMFLYGMGSDLTWNPEKNQTGMGMNWQRLKTWLLSKLSWDVYADQDALTNEFFTEYYKAAAEPMQRFYNEECLWFAHLAETTNLSFKYLTTDAIKKKENWPYALLIRWLQYINDAYENIAVYQRSDPSLYAKLKERINLESLSIRYLMLCNYGNRISGGENGFATELINDVYDLRVAPPGSELASLVTKYIK